jgi:hypothetical protein
MRLLAATLPKLARLVPTNRHLVGAGILLVLVALELVGRLTQSDLHDGLAACVLIAGSAMLLFRKPRRHFPGLALLRRQGQKMFEHFRANYGLDLRGSPTIPSRFPSGAWFILLGLVTWTSVASAAWWLFPEGWREIGVRSSYTVYLITVTLLWASLIVTMLGSLLATAYLMGWHLNMSRAKPHDRKSFLLMLVLAYLGLVIVLMKFVPTIFVLGFCSILALMAFGLAVGYRSGEPAILWRSGTGRPIYSIAENRILAGLAGVAVLFFANLVLTACGGRLFSVPSKDDPMAITMYLGTSVAWMLPGFFVIAAYSLWVLRRIDPAIRTPLAISLQNHLTPIELRQATRMLRNQGWTVRRADEPRGKTDIRLELVHPEFSEATEFQPVWPLKVSLNDLTNPDVLFRIGRRDELRLRRLAYKGMRRIFQKGMTVKKRKGGSYHFSPQWWLGASLIYDEPQRSSDAFPAPRRVGPWYTRAFHPRVRQHMHKVLRAVEIDEIIIEDGVSYKAIERVMRSLFEIYDKHNGERRAEDHLLGTFPRVRTMIHECAPGAPKVRLRKNDEEAFDESQYEEMSRARVLHIFKDDDAADALSEAPFDRFWQPSPAGSFS